MTVINRTDWSE